MKKRKGLWLILLSLFLLLGLLGGTFQYSRSWENAFFLEPFHTLNTPKKRIALTFDDGPNPGRTPALLDLLEEKEVKATFFMLGSSIEKYPDLAREVVEKEHLVGNHSYSHPRMVAKTPAFLREEITKTDSLIQAIGHPKPLYFRPPYSSKYLVLPWVLRSLGKVLVTGSYDPPAEYGTPLDGEKVAAQVIENVKPGLIVYLHDGKSTDEEAFVWAVGKIIDELRAEGYQFVRLDENFGEE